MPINVSFTMYFEDILTHAGFLRRPWRHGILGTRVYTRGQRAVVVIPTIEIPHPSVAPIPQSIDDYFERLRNVLIGLANRYSVTDVSFPGGGNIPLPNWFIQWCNQNGLRVHILDADEPVDFDFNN